MENFKLEVTEEEYDFIIESLIKCPSNRLWKIYDQEYQDKRHALILRLDKALPEDKRIYDDNGKIREAVFKPHEFVQAQNVIIQNDYI